MPVFVGCLLCCASPALAGEKTTATVTAVQADGSLRLADGTHAVMANLYFPDRALAETWLNAHALQQPLTFSTGEEDRYGRTAIKSELAENLLHEGIAVIYLGEGKAPKAWLAAEAAAARAKRGVWGQADFVLTPANAAQHSGEFHVVEGRITRIYEAKTATYLNFGNDWHTDFSVTIPARNRRGFADVLTQLHEGSTVRMRGALYTENGPMLRVTKVDHVELVR